MARLASTGSTGAERQGPSCRIERELADFRHRRHERISLAKSRRKPLLLHFAFYGFPDGSPYHGGCYHGTLTPPREYPYRPPEVRMLTENGRFEVDKSICTTFSAWHPEEWSPACTAAILLEALLVYFEDSNEHGIGSLLDVSARVRAELASASRAANLRGWEFRELFPELAAQVPQVTANAIGGCSQNEATDIDLEAASNASSSLLCWVCLTEGSEDDLLLRPCSCRGTSGGVHLACLTDFVRHRVEGSSREPAPREPLRCAVCRQPYAGFSIKRLWQHAHEDAKQCHELVGWLGLLSCNGVLIIIFLQVLELSVQTRLITLCIAFLFFGGMFLALWCFVRREPDRLKTEARWEVLYDAPKEHRQAQEVPGKKEEKEEEREKDEQGM